MQPTVPGRAQPIRCLGSLVAAARAAVLAAPRAGDVTRPGGAQTGSIGAAESMVASFEALAGSSSYGCQRACSANLPDAAVDYLDELLVNRFVNAALQGSLGRGTRPQGTTVRLSSRLQP